MIDPSSFKTILFAASIKRWPAHSYFPFGKVIQKLGQMGEIDNETAALLTDAGVYWNTFSQSVLDCLPPTVTFCFILYKLLNLAMVDTCRRNC